MIVWLTSVFILKEMTICIVFHSNFWEKNKQYFTMQSKMAQYMPTENPELT